MKNIYTLFFLIAACTIQAQTFTNYTTDDGLINNSVNCLWVNSNDELWFGTQEGISHFDGTTWTNYDTDSSPELVNNTIFAIFTDNEDNLWVGTDFGVNKFDGTSWTTYTEDDGLADNRIKYINQSADGRMWFANNDGLSILDGDAWTSYTADDGISFGGINFVTFANNGNALLGTPLSGYLEFDGTNFIAITEDEGLLNDKIRSIAVAPNGNRWIGNADGISVFDQNNDFITHHELIFELPPPDVLNPVEDLVISPGGRVWVGVYVDYLVTVGGVSTYLGADWSDYDVNEGLVGPVVRRLALDSQNNLWVATGTGISKLSDLPSSTVNPIVDNALKMFPNPTASELNLEIPAALLGTDYQIYDNVGRLVKTGRVIVERMTIQVGELAQGVYRLAIDGVYSRQIVKF